MVALHILNFLSHRINVEIFLLTLLPVDWKKIARDTNIPICTDRVHNRTAFCPTFVLKQGGKLELLKLAYLHREAKRISSEFDICVSTYNELDFGRKGFQYIHHPSFADRKLLNRFGMVGKRSIVDYLGVARRIYEKVRFTVANERQEGFALNVTAVNSIFMRNVVQEAYGIEGIVLYPGFIPDGENDTGETWEQRSLRFVSIGRIARDKNYFNLIDTFGMLARVFPEAKFTIIGKSGDPELLRDLWKRAMSHDLQLEILSDANEALLFQILRTSKFYIHSKMYEHFGISILEAAGSGCLTFVHDSGGAREIVSPSMLRYITNEDLVRKVVQLSRDDESRTKVLNELQAGLSRFKARMFYVGLQKIFETNWDLL
ncbi:MAG: glycosyltransferase [Bacteroidetes bacterium]|nr:glycosyltransferase [Bacteroidota bacterium]MCL5738965.1 glycosyltransferase [Bacteroidota bacterium]